VPCAAAVLIVRQGLYQRGNENEIKKKGDALEFENERLACL
jgi:hypothetical protein